jgi:hypothetical protein
MVVWGRIRPKEQRSGSKAYGTEKVRTNHIFAVDTSIRDGKYPNAAL